MSTPHNQANKGDIAKTVLMPGDPLRAKFIAEEFLTDARLVNQVRGMLAYTGLYKGKEVTVMASGMGMPSIGIYSYELYTQYDVENIIRIGSAGAYTADLKLFDVVLAEKAWSESSFAKTQNGQETDTTLPSEALNEKLVAASKRTGILLTPVIVHSSDVFYRESTAQSYQEVCREHGCACVEMESFALFHNASVLHKNAACLLTISDSFATDEKVSPEGRQTAFTNMMKIALEAAVAE